MQKCLTVEIEEEKEAQELQNTKDEIRYVKQESAATLDRALAKADEAFERALATRANLASQEERLVNTYVFLLGLSVLLFTKVYADFFL